MRINLIFFTYSFFFFFLFLFFTCTENALYNFDCTSTGLFSKIKTYKLQRRMPLESIHSVSLSTFADHYFVVCLEYPGDGRGDYLMQSSRKAEIVTCLKNAIEKKTKKLLKLNFNNNLDWKRKKNKISQAIFQEDTNIAETECRENGNRKTSTLTIQVGAGMCSRAPIQLDTSYRASSKSSSSSSSSRATTSKSSAKSSAKSSSSRGGESKRQSSIKKAVVSSTTTKTPPSVPSRGKKAAPPPVPSRKEMVKALFDYDGADEDELSMTTGMRLTVISRKEPDAPEGWVKCAYGGKEGLVPANYVGKVK